MNKKQRENKYRSRQDINRSLIAISFTIFGLIISINPELLKGSFLIPLQLTLAIPLLLSCMYARSKLLTSRKPQMWEDYGYVTYLLGYSFIVNVIGILLSASVSLFVGMTFLLFNILSSVIYSVFEVMEDKYKIRSRIKKDLFFALLILLGGILPALGVYWKLFIY